MVVVPDHKELGLFRVDQKLIFTAPGSHTGTFHQKRNDGRKFLEYSDIIQISRLLRESDRSWN